MANDLHERVAERIRVGGRTEDVAAAIIPMILEEAAKVADAAMRVHAMEVVQGRGGTDAGNPGAAIRAQEETK